LRFALNICLYTFLGQNKNMVKSDFILNEQLFFCYPNLLMKKLYIYIILSTVLFLGTLCFVTGLTKQPDENQDRTLTSDNDFKQNNWNTENELEFKLETKNGENCEREKIGELILYHSAHCPACHRFIPIWDNVIPKLPPNIQAKKIECTKDNQQLWEGIYVVPTVHFVNAQKQKLPFDGQNDKNGLEKFISSLK